MSSVLQRSRAIPSDVLPNRYVNIVPPSRHGGTLTFDKIVSETDNFSKPALFKSLAPIDDRFGSRTYYDTIDPTQTLQWRQDLRSSGLDAFDRG